MIKPSIIIPVFNREHLITETLDLATRQTLSPHEVIVCDDGSTDHTAEICRQFLKAKSIPHQVLILENSGPSAARRVGASSASGDWFFFLDSDDLWDVDYLETIQGIVENYRPDAVVSNFRIFDRMTGKIAFPSKFETAPGRFWEEGFEEKEDAFIAERPSLFRKALEFQPCFASSLSCSREFYHKIGGFTLTSRKLKSEDAHFIRRVYFYGRVAFARKPKITIIFHERNRSKNTENSLDFTGKSFGRLEILKMMMAEKPIAETFGLELQREIEESTIQLFHQYFWYRQYDQVVRLFPDLETKQRKLKVWVKFFWSWIKYQFSLIKKRKALHRA